MIRNSGIPVPLQWCNFDMTFHGENLDSIKFAKEGQIDSVRKCQDISKNCCCLTICKFCEIQTAREVGPIRVNAHTISACNAHSHYLIINEINSSIKTGRGRHQGKRGLPPPCSTGAAQNLVRAVHVAAVSTSAWRRHPSTFDCIIGRLRQFYRSISTPLRRRCSHIQHCFALLFPFALDAVDGTVWTRLCGQ